MANCKACKHFAEFKEPFHYDAPGYQDGVTVFGVCFKRCNNYICFPVYIVEGGHNCTDFRKKPKVKVIQADPTQMEMDLSLGR